MFIMPRFKENFSYQPESRPFSAKLTYCPPQTIMWSTTFIEMASRAALILLVASISAFDGFKVPPG